MVPLHLRSLLSLVIFTAICHGQNSTLQLKNGGGEPNTTPAGQAETGRTQGRTPHSNVYCGIQDKAGNLWFGTEEGAFRYDGHDFTKFTTADGLSANAVSSILDKAGNLWFGTNIGVCRYDGKNFTRLLLPATDGDDFLPFHDASDLKRSAVYPYTVTNILQDIHGNLWFGTLQAGIYRYDGQAFTNFLAAEVVRSMLADKAGNVWVGSWSNGGVYRYDGQSFHNLTTKIGLTDGMIGCMLEDRAGNIWFGTRDQGLYRYDGASLTKFSDDMSIWSIYEDKAGNIWFGTDGHWGNDGHGVYRYDGKSITNFTTKDGLSGNNVFSILQDKAGNLWFGTRNMGLCRYDGKSFTNFTD